jgi:hypothetical protein
MDIEVGYQPLVRINAPEFFEREDFQEFLNRAVDPDNEETTATWHNGGEPGDYSDLFVTYDNGEGSDALPSDGDDSDMNLIPQDIWDEICEEMENRGVDHALLWISNLGQPDT